MTDLAAPPAPRAFDLASDEAKARVRRRHRTEARFRLYGLAAIAFAAVMLVVLIGDVALKAWPAFTEQFLPRGPEDRKG